jgi:hypothetical protein
MLGMSNVESKQPAITPFRVIRLVIGLVVSLWLGLMAGGPWEFKGGFLLAGLSLCAIGGFIGGFISQCWHKSYSGGFIAGIVVVFACSWVASVVY